jgi:outer membrane lipoprotein-sorting protein
MLAVIFGLLLAAIAPQPSPAALDVHTILKRMEQRNPTLQTYQAHVHVNAHMLSFPWLSPKLDGTAYYKNPDKFEVVFNRMPSYAKGFDKFFGDVDQPSEWQREWNVSSEGLQNVDGHQLIALRLTKKIRSDQITDSIAYVDPSTYQVLRMDWHYTNGDKITMTQTYKQQGPYSVIATRHVDVHRHVHAVADATYAQYQTNIAVSDAVFAKK